MLINSSNRGLIKNNASTETGAHANAGGDTTTASGDNSLAIGSNTTASGTASVAEGASNTASGNWSHAEGAGNTASGDKSHVEGNANTAQGVASHAEGDTCQAFGQNSHVEGNLSQAYGLNSHAEGTHNCIAWGEGSHAEGWNSFQIGDNGHAEGDTTLCSAEGGHSEGESTACGFRPVNCTLSGTTVTISGNHVKKFVVAGAFNGQVRFFNLAGGSGSDPVVADRTVQTGPTYNGGLDQTTFTIDNVIGGRTSGSVVDTFRGEAAHAEGQISQCVGAFGHAEGENNYVEVNYNGFGGFAGHAEGSGCVVSGNYGHAEGNNAQVYDTGAHAQNISTIANGIASHAGGDGSTANAYQAFAHGDACIANANNSLALGFQCQTGPTAYSFSLSGTTVTITGVDATPYFTTQATFFNLNSGVNGIVKAVSTTISAVGFTGGNTTFTIASGALDDRTGGSVVPGDYADSSIAVGLYATSFQKGMVAHSNDRFSVHGDAQYIRTLVRGTTTNNTPTNLTSPVEFIPQTSHTYALTITICGRRTDTVAVNNNAMFKRMVLCTDAGIQGTAQTIGTDINNPGWSVAFSFSSGALHVTVTGGTGATIHWVATIEATEVG